MLISPEIWTNLNVINMIKIMYFLRHAKKRVNGEIPIYVKVELQNGSFTLSTGKSVLNDVWEQTHHLRVHVKNVRCENQ